MKKTKAKNKAKRPPTRRRKLANIDDQLRGILATLTRLTETVAAMNRAAK